ncbi:MAG TPA: hypothetical protein VMF52_13230 [Steroidobacteraceae bacterium]|nr:hypothetical protein [Steroidobacteraceae bacterium]
MGNSKWLVVAAALLAAGTWTDAARAENRAELQITPYVGYAHVRVDSPYLRDGQTDRFDMAMGGATVGFLTPFGLVIEAGGSFGFHEEIFSNDTDLGLDQDYAAIGYQIDFADGWRFVPKVGRVKWKLESDDRDLLDLGGVRHETLRGYDNFYEASLMHHVSRSIAMGLNFRDIDTQFGHDRSGAFVVTFGF